MTTPTPGPGTPTGPASPTAPGEPAAPVVARLAAALEASHAAIFAYGPIGVRLTGAEAEAAREAEEAHRARRDTLVLALAARGADPPAAAASYQLPFPVDGAAAARRLAAVIEERVAGVWRAVLPAVTGDERADALAAMIDAAVRATGWRLAAGITPATVPFPGDPPVEPSPSGRPDGGDG